MVVVISCVVVVKLSLVVVVANDEWLCVTECPWLVGSVVTVVGFLSRLSADEYSTHSITLNRYFILLTD